MMKPRPKGEDVLPGTGPLGVWANVDTYAARVLMLSFFLPEKLQSLAVMATGLYFVVRTYRSKEPVASANYWWALVIGSIYLLYLFSIPLTPQQYKPFLSLLCQRKASLLLMPFAFAIIAQSYRAVIAGEFMYFVYGCVVSCLVGNADFVYHVWRLKEGIHDLSHVQYRVMFERSTGIHPTYMGVFLAFSVCISLFMAPFRSVIKYTLVYLLLIFLLALLAKSPLIALAVIFVHYAFVRRRTLYQYKLLFLGLFASVGAACFFIPFVGQRLREVLQFAGVGKPGNVSENSVYVRKLIWNVDTDLIRQYWLTGVGPGRMLHMLHERYFFYTVASHFSIGYLDPHNEYFSEWLCFGVLGIALLLAILVVHFAKAFAAKNHLYLYLLLILSITFSTETVLSRQAGVLFFAVFTSLFFFYRTAPAARRCNV